jgi:hypothetical protein
VEAKRIETKLSRGTTKKNKVVYDRDQEAGPGQVEITGDGVDAEMESPHIS